jgi:hypothetical protein
MATQEIKNYSEMSAGELELHLKDKMAAKFDSKRNIYKHTDYEDLSASTLNYKQSLEKKVTINGAKFIGDINEDDYLFTAGEIKAIMDGE